MDTSCLLMDPPAGKRASSLAAWLGQDVTDSGAAFRLFCLPYAGGGAAIYHGWHAIAPDHIQVCAIELPGRGHRMAEAPFQRLVPMVRALASALRPLLDQPFAIFGHSMGGLIAFELARALRASGMPSPAHLFVSAIAAPGTLSTWHALRDAPDGEVKEELRALEGTPAALLENDDLMAVMLPIVRADFTVLETYEYRPDRPLDVPITVFGGMSDHVVPPWNLTGWRRESTRGSRLQMFPGGHFFLQSAANDVVAAIGRTLDFDVGDATALRGSDEHEANGRSLGRPHWVGAGSIAPARCLDGQPPT